MYFIDTVLVRMVSREGRLEELRGRAAALVARLEELEEGDGQDRRARSVRRKLYGLRLRIRNLCESSGDIRHDVSVMDDDVCGEDGEGGSDSEFEPPWGEEGRRPWPARVARQAPLPHSRCTGDY